MSFLSRLRGGGEPTFHDLHRIPSREDLLDKENVVNSGRGNNLFTISPSNKSAFGKASSFKGSDKISLQNDNSNKHNTKNSQNPSTARQPLQRVASTGGMSVRSTASITTGNSVKDSRFASQRAITASVPTTTAPAASTDSWYSQAMFGNSIEPEDDNSTVLSGGSVQTFQSHHLNPMALPSHDDPAVYSPPSSARSIQSHENASLASHLGDYQYRSHAMPRLPSQQSFYGRGQGIAQQKPTQSQQSYPSLSSHSSFTNPYEDAEDLTNEQEEQEMHHPGAYYDADYDSFYPIDAILETGDEDDEFPASASQIDQETIEMVFSKARHDRQDFVLDMLISGRFNPNSRDQHGNTLLHVCAQNNHRALASKIIKQCGGVDKIDINAKNKKKSTPLDYCEKYGHVKFRMWLATLGAKYGNHGKEQFQTSRNTNA